MNQINNCYKTDLNDGKNDRREFLKTSATLAGGVIPAQDYQYLYDAGVVAIFGPGTNVAAAGKKILEVLLAAHEE